MAESTTVTNTSSTFNNNSNPDFGVKNTNTALGRVQHIYLESTNSTSTLSNVSASAISVTLSAANSSRKGLVVVNDSTVNLYLKYGSSASSTSYTYLLYPGDFYVMKQEDFTFEIITGIWASATGAARVTEIT